jgi:penicillin-binding protein 2
MKAQDEQRKLIIIGLILLAGVIFIGRLFYLQIIDKSYILSAQNNVVRVITQYPARGLIYDRHGELLVFNEAAFDLMVIPSQVTAFDTLEFSQLIGLDKTEIKDRLMKARNYSMRKASIFEKQISKESFSFFKEKLHKFPGFYVQSRTLRYYPTRIAAHTLGYIGEVDRNTIESNPYYKSGDYIGISGLESTYEEYLRGQKGVKRVLVDVFGREKGSFQEGRFDSSAVKGQDIYISIDAQLQAYGERLMTNKKGSIVAIEPSTGEILALVSSPSYDPNLLVGRIRSTNYQMLSDDSLQPLFNRALSATYPPGSTFKSLNALVALQEGISTPSTSYYCQGTATVPIKCSHYHTTPLNMYRAIEISCNPYFWQTFRSIMVSRSDIHDAYTMWRKHAVSFNFGNRFNSDLFNESRGFIPLPDYYDKYYGKNGWRAMTIRSLSIGQGEILATPLQLANFAAIISNRGYYYKPHLIRSISDSIPDLQYREKIVTTISPTNCQVVVEGMSRVMDGPEGTGRWYRLEDIAICGKTGTAENPHGKDHSIFVSFAPKDNPRIAVAVVVENSGFGATWAAPIATLMIEKYINGEVKRLNVEESMISSNLINP